MTELSPEAKQLLAQLRDVDDPTPDERNSADAALRRTLAAHGLRNLTRLPAPVLRQAAAAKSLAAPSGGATKLIWGLGAALVTTVGLWMASVPHTSVRPPIAAIAPPVVQSAPSASPASVPAPLPELALPATPAELPRRPATHGSARQTEGSQSERSSLPAELRFLSSIDAEIRAGAYARALQRLDQNKSTSQLHEERSAMRVLALCGRDNDQNAARARANFLKASPSSVLAARVRAACPGVSAP